MYGQQATTGVPELDAVLATAQMFTPDNTPTVAAQVAMAAQQKMQPQGIAQGMPQARQDFQAAMPSMMRNMQQAQMQQMVQQAMQPKPAGIEGLQSNVRMADGGVVGYAEGGTPRTYGYAPDYEDARRLGIDLSPYDAPEVRKQKLERLQKMREFDKERQSFGDIPTEASVAKDELLQRAYADPRRAMDIIQPPSARTTAPAVAAAPAPQAPAPRPPAQRPPAPAQQAAPTGVAAALAQRPTYDTAGIAAAGTPYIQAGEGDVGRIRKVEGERAEFEKTLPDLSAKGIAALQQRMRDVETAETTRKENLGLDRVIQQLLGRAQGAGGAARADIQFMNAQRAAEDAFSQARLGNQQAQLLLEKAQQERQLGRFDRAIALEKDAANLMEKARDNALKAQQIAQSTAGSQFQGAVQMRGQDVQALEGELNRANALKVEGIRAATREGAGDIAQKRLALQQLKADPEYTAAMNKIKELSKAAGLSSSPTIQTAFRAAQQEAATIARRYGLTPQDIGATGGDTAAPAGQRIVDFASIK
jgi:hypothetical protein